MSLKRGARNTLARSDDLPSHWNHSSKRRKLSPLAENASSNSIDTETTNSTSCSISSASSERPALVESPPTSVSSGYAGTSSDGGDVSDDSSSSSSLSDDSSSEAEDERDEKRDEEPDILREEDIITIGGPKKPGISKAGVVAAGQAALDLQSRLRALLPQLAAANEDLVTAGGQSLEDVKDGDAHIAMELGLGVLEEKRGESDGSGDDSESESDEEISNAGAERDVGEESTTHKRGEEGEVLARLMGRQKTRRKAGVEEIA